MSTTTEPPINSFDAAFHIIFGILAAAFVLGISLGFNRNQPFQAGVFPPPDTCMCPQGKIGPAGVGFSGAPGARGEQGRQGERGERGAKGDDGRQGPMGYCAHNPNCTRGEKGEKGDKGDRGLPGIGWQGQKGDPGVQGASGPTGAQGPSGPSGATGAQGIQGLPGVCDCFNISNITFGDLNITNSLQLIDNSTFTCEVGSFIDAGCLVQGACPNFSNCTLSARNLIVSGGSPSNIQFGASGDPVGASILMGTSNPGGYQITSFVMYSSLIRMEGSGIVILRSVGGGQTLIDAQGIGSIINLNSVGNIIGSALTGFIQFTANVAGITFTNNDGTAAIRSISAGDILAQTGTMSAYNVTSNMIFFQKNNVLDTGSLWWYTNPLYNIVYNQWPYVLNTTNAASIVFTQQLLIRQGIVSNDGMFLRLGPAIDVGIGYITTSQTSLTLFDGTFTNQTISLAAEVQNLTPLEPANYSTLQAGYLLLNDPNGTRVTSGVFLVDGQFMDLQTSLLNNASTPPATGNVPNGYVFVDDSARFSGNVLIDGTLQVTACTGCTSDAKTKENVEPLNSDESFERIMNLKPVRFNYKQEYRDQVGDDGSTKHGFIAQEVEKLFPFAVKEHKDIKYLNKDMLIADLVAAVQHLVKLLNSQK